MERVADYIIRKIYEAGAEHIFMVSGRGILYLTDAVARSSVQSICTYHEQGASYSAMAYASAKGGIGACLISTGCASANAVAAVLCAYQDNLPVVFISGNNPLSENTRHTGIPIRTYGSQEADIISIVSSITKYSVMLDKKETVAYEVEKALYLAQNGRKGPVWIDVPLDVQNMRIEESEQKHYRYMSVALADMQTEAVVAELNKAKRPILLIGGGTKLYAEQVHMFCTRAQIPVVFSPSAADVFGTQNPLSIGAVGSIGGSRAGCFAIQNSDYVLAVGTKLCSQLTGMKEHFARAAKITVVDIDPAEHTKDGVHIEKNIIADAGEFLSALTKNGGVFVDETWREKCLHWKKIFSLDNEPFLKKLRTENRLDLYSICSELEQYLPQEATVITDAGFEELIVPSALRYRSGQRCIFPAAQGAMGYAIPAVIGAYFAGRKDLVCVVGDGSIMMNIQELQIIATLNIPVKILIISNNMYAVIRKRQRDLFRKRTIGNDPSDGVPSPNFSAIAQGFGFKYRLVSDRTGFCEMLPLLFTDNSSPEIIEIISDPDQKYFHESYGIDENRRLVHRPIEDLSPFLDCELIKKEMIIQDYE